MNAVIYALTEPRENDDRLLQQRIEECQTWAAANGHVIVRVFQDRRRSGANLDRPAFRDLCEFVLNHGAEAVIVSTLRQLARRRQDGELIADVFDEHEIQVYAVDEGRISPLRIANPIKMEYTTPVPQREACPGRSGKPQPPRSEFTSPRTAPA